MTRLGREGAPCRQLPGTARPRAPRTNSLLVLSEPASDGFITVPAIRRKSATVLAALAIAACGSSSASHSSAGTGSAVTGLRAHPQVVEPVAGQGAGRTTTQLA